MTCEIDIDTSAVWSIGNYMKASGRTNYNTLWRDLNNLNSALNSLRTFNNSSGSVNSYVNSAQQNLNRCKTYCIEPTTNAMNGVASFLQSAAVQYEQAEKEVCAIWGNRAASNKLNAKDIFAAAAGAIAGAFVRGAESLFDHAADFMANLVNAAKAAWDFVLPRLDVVIDAITAAGIMMFAVSNPVGWVFLGAFAFATVYKYATGGESLLGDMLEQGAIFMGLDAEVASKAKSFGKFAQGLGELFLPGGGIAKAAGAGLKGFDKATKVASYLENGSHLTKTLRGLPGTAVSVAAEKTYYGMQGVSTAGAVLNKDLTKITAPVASFCGRSSRNGELGTGLVGALQAKKEPMKIITQKYGLSEKTAEKVNTAFDTAKGVDDSAHAIEDIGSFVSGDSSNSNGGK